MSNTVPNSPTNSPTYTLTPWGARMLRKLRPWKTRREQFVESEMVNGRKTWIIPMYTTSPGYSPEIEGLSPDTLSSQYQHYGRQISELDSGEDNWLSTPTPWTTSVGSPRFSSAETAVPSEMMEYPYHTKRETMSSLSADLFCKNVRYPSTLYSDKRLQELPAAETTRRRNLKTPDLPSLRILTQPEKTHSTHVDAGEGFPSMTATLNGPVEYTAECVAAANVSSWLVKLELNDDRENASPSVKVEHGSDPSVTSPSAPTTPERWSPSAQSQTSVFASEGEASFVLGDDPVAWATLGDSLEYTTLVATFAKAFVSSYLDRTTAATDSPGSPSQPSSASNSSGSAPCGKSSSLATIPTSPNARPGEKRPARGEDEEGARRRKLPKVSTSPTSPTESKLLACPYAKFDPRRYSERNETEKNYRGCSSCFLKDINRLKQHLYRVHRRPEHHCPCCFASFDSREALDLHIVERACECTPSPFEEKMTPDQLTAIKRRDLGRDRSEAWFDIYKILFPNSPPPLNPYVESVHTLSVQEFMAFFEDEGRAVLSSEINWRMFGYRPPTPQFQLFVESVLTESISIMVRRLDDRLRQSPVLTSPSSSLPA